MKLDSEKMRKLLVDLAAAEALVHKVQVLLQDDASQWDEADLMLRKATCALQAVRSHPTYVGLKIHDSDGRPRHADAHALALKNSPMNRYQVTASIYDEQHENHPGLIAFEFVNYGYDGAELSGLLEIQHEDDPALSQRIRAAVRQLAGEENLPLAAGVQPDWKSGSVPITWRLLIATGSKTDFVLWVEVETMDAAGGYTTIRSGHLSGSMARQLQSQWDDILSEVMEKNPPLVAIQHQCSTCGAEWEAGEYKLLLECGECNGFAKERACNCSPNCPETVIRDSAASHANRSARTFPCARTDDSGINWTGDPWAIEALASKLRALAERS